jgi:hypothetical protein
MLGVELAPVARRAPRPVVRGDGLPVPQGAADGPREAGRRVGADRDDPSAHLRGLWGAFLDGLQDELAVLRQRCLDAEPGDDADFAYSCLASHYAVMEWAAKEIDRHYLLDRWRVAVDWSWDSGRPPEPAPTYEGDHTLTD